MPRNATLTNWLTTFWKILILPTPKTFISESKKAAGKSRSAFAWLVFFALYTFIFSSFLLGRVSITGFIGIVLVIPFTIVLFTSAMNFVYQRVFRKKQPVYDKLLYLNTAIVLSVQFLFVPILTFILVPLSSITFNAIVTDVVLFYQFILIMIAFQSVSGLKFWQVAVTVTLAFLTAGMTLLFPILLVWSMIGGVNTAVR